VTLFDPGLQPERTRLAWQRTLLALAVGSLVALRLLPPALGTWAIGFGLAGLLLAGVLWPLAARRSAIGYRALLSDSDPLPGGGLLLVLAVVATTGGALGLVWTLLR
jgi:uncharacterized membrane protein YidH (DUF202 family)